MKLLGRIAFYIIIYPWVWILYLTGMILFYIVKPVKALAFLLTFSPYSALEEITDWKMASVNLRDL